MKNFVSSCTSAYRISETLKKVTIQYAMSEIHIYIFLSNYYFSHSKMFFLGIGLSILVHIYYVFLWFFFCRPGHERLTFVKDIEMRPGNLRDAWNNRLCCTCIVHFDNYSRRYPIVVNESKGTGSGKRAKWIRRKFACLTITNAESKRKRIRPNLLFFLRGFYERTVSKTFLDGKTMENV